MNNPPCKNCVRRVLGCHATCAEYREYKDELERIHKAQAGDKDYTLYERRVINSKLRAYHSARKRNADYRLTRRRK